MGLRLFVRLYCAPSCSFIPAGARLLAGEEPSSTAGAANTRALVGFTTPYSGTGINKRLVNGEGVVGGWLVQLVVIGKAAMQAANMDRSAVSKCSPIPLVSRTNQLHSKVAAQQPAHLLLGQPLLRRRRRARAAVSGAGQPCPLAAPVAHRTAAVAVAAA